MLPPRPVSKPPISRLELNISQQQQPPTSSSSSDGGGGETPVASPSTATGVNPLTPGGSGPRGASVSSTKAEILILVRQVESEIQAHKKIIAAAESAWAEKVAAYEANEAAIQRAAASAAENKVRHITTPSPPTTTATITQVLLPLHASRT
eukprot:COSAG05_NODE_329_length_11294_cov_59.570076_9_plen_151_part_00